MFKLDNKPFKKNLWGNAILSLSFVVSKEMLKILAFFRSSYNKVIPIPCMNVISDGANADLCIFFQ